MSNRLSEIREQIALLEKEEKRILDSERSSALEKVKTLISLYHFTANELGFKVGKKIESAQQDKVSLPPKYRNPKNPGDTWAGGRGRKPKFVQEHLAAGGKLEDLEIK